MLCRADYSRLRGPFSEGTLSCTPVMKTASIGYPSEQSTGVMSPPDFGGFSVSGQPSAGREFGDPIDREVSQSRQDRAKIVADWDLDSPAGFDDLRLWLQRAVLKRALGVIERNRWWPNAALSTRLAASAKSLRAIARYFKHFVKAPSRQFSILPPGRQDWFG
jgi:hypothetical protein